MRRQFFQLILMFYLFSSVYPCNTGCISCDKTGLTCLECHPTYYYSLAKRDCVESCTESISHTMETHGAEAVCLDKTIAKSTIDTKSAIVIVSVLGFLASFICVSYLLVKRYKSSRHRTRVSHSNQNAQGTLKQQVPSLQPQTVVDLETIPTTTRESLSEVYHQ